MAVYASISTTSFGGVAPVSVTLDGTDSFDDGVGTIVAYSWVLGDGTTSTASSLSKTYGAGTYTVTLTVTNNLGETGTSTIEITVQAPSFGPVPDGAPGAFFYKYRDLIESYDAPNKFVIFPWPWSGEDYDYDLFEFAARMAASVTGAEWATLGILEDEEIDDTPYRSGNILATTAGHKLIASLCAAADVESA